MFTKRITRRLQLNMPNTIPYNYLNVSNNLATSNLTNAVTCTGEAYEEIAKLVDDQPRNDWEHLGDTMHDYRGMLAGWPGILQIHSVNNIYCLSLHISGNPQIFHGFIVLLHINFRDL